MRRRSLAGPRRRSTTWSDVWERYRRHRLRPVWGNLAFYPDARGRLSGAQLAALRRQAREAAARVERACQRLLTLGAIPRDPRRLTQSDLSRVVRRRLVPRRWLSNFFEAWLFDRDGYTCAYCAREAERMWKASRHLRTLHFQVDHDRPRVAGGHSFDLTNARTACQRCNLMKGSLPGRLFRAELRSVARSVLGRH